MNDKQTSSEIFAEYQTRFVQLENMFADSFGYYPLYTSSLFWQDKQVKTVECLLILWWDLKDILAKRNVQ